MASPAVGTGTLRRLGELDTGGHPVLSVYLGADHPGPSPAAAGERELDAVVADVERLRVRSDVSRLHETLRCMAPLAHGTQSLALFSSAEGAAFAAVPLPSPVEPMAVVDSSPWLEPLAGVVTAGDNGVAVVERGTTRLFRGTSRMFVEFATLHDEPDREHALGCRSQLEHPCCQEEHLVEQARRVAELLLRADRRRAFDQLVVITSGDLWPVVETALHDDLRRRLTGLVELHLGDATPREIARAVAEYSGSRASRPIRSFPPGDGGFTRLERRPSMPSLAQ